MQDYVSVWQVREALQQSRIVPTFVLQYDGRFGPPPRSLTNAYQSLRSDLTSISAQVLALDSRSSMSATRDLVSIIQTAYNVSIIIYHAIGIEKLGWKIMFDVWIS